MMNYWWATRPKRSLSAVPDLLANFAEIALDRQWSAQRDIHLFFEDSLEQEELKAVGDRRNQQGSGGRTHAAFLRSLGLHFKQKSTGLTRLTLAGEALLAGDSPVEVLKHQVIKYQFPSNYTCSGNSEVNSRFRIHPFVFLLRLLDDSQIDYLTEEEIAKIIIVEAETEESYQYIVNRIVQFRNIGDKCLSKDFFKIYTSTRHKHDFEHPYRYLTDIANTFANWLGYTQLVSRGNGIIKILPEKREEVKSILNSPPQFITRPDDHENYQRQYGVDPKHKKDTRRFSEIKSLTPKMIDTRIIQKAFFNLSAIEPISTISTIVIDKISEASGIDPKFVEDTLQKLYPQGSIDSFMSSYFEMAFKGREKATAFEKATVKIFSNVFGFESKHVGPKGRSPDVLILSDSDGYQAILDNKATFDYSISNDHHNRMVQNYIGELSNYSSSNMPLAFYSYLAGSFSQSICKQLSFITEKTGVPGSAMNVTNMIQMVKKNGTSAYSHSSIRKIFSLNREILLRDL